jgi:hypothetical protein
MNNNNNNNNIKNNNNNNMITNRSRKINRITIMRLYSIMRERILYMIIKMIDFIQMIFWIKNRLKIKMIL